MLKIFLCLKSFCNETYKIFFATKIEHAGFGSSISMQINCSELGKWPLDRQRPSTPSWVLLPPDHQAGHRLWRQSFGQHSGHTWHFHVSPNAKNKENGISFERRA